MSAHGKVLVNNEQQHLASVNTSGSFSPKEIDLQENYSQFSIIPKMKNNTLFEHRLGSLLGSKDIINMKMGSNDITTFSSQNGVRSEAATPVISNSNFFTSPTSLCTDTNNDYIDIEVLDLKANIARRYPDNRISTCKYGLFSFFPLNLLHQLRKVNNMYFLLTAVLTLIPGASPVNPATAIAPLFIVIGVAMLKDGYEDFIRYRDDTASNNVPVNVLRHGKFVKIKSSNILVGEILRVHYGEEIKADCILLNSSLPDGIAYVNTANLDGEGNAKVKRAVPETVEELGTITQLLEKCHITTSEVDKRIFTNIRVTFWMEAMRVRQAFWKLLPAFLTRKGKKENVEMEKIRIRKREMYGSRQRNIHDKAYFIEDICANDPLSLSDSDSLLSVKKNSQSCYSANLGACESSPPPPSVFIPVINDNAVYQSSPSLPMKKHLGHMPHLSTVTAPPALGELRHSSTETLGSTNGTFQTQEMKKSSKRSSSINMDSIYASFTNDGYSTEAKSNCGDNNVVAEPTKSGFFAHTSKSNNIENQSEDIIALSIKKDKNNKEYIYKKEERRRMNKNGIYISACFPDPSLSSWNGQIHLDGKTIALNFDQFLVRGSVLTNVEYVDAVVIGTGIFTKIALNIKEQQIKSSNFDKNLNILVACVMFIMFSIDVVMSGLLINWIESMRKLDIMASPGNWFWYIHFALDMEYAKHFGWAFINYFILTGFLIPISLFIVLEINKRCQMVLIGYDHHLAKLRDGQWIFCHPKTSNLTSQLAQIKMIFTDKTGTLTDNCMLYMGGYFEGFTYSVDPTLSWARKAGNALDSEYEVVAKEENEVRWDASDVAALNIINSDGNSENNKDYAFAKEHTPISPCLPLPIKNVGELCRYLLMSGYQASQSFLCEYRLKQSAVTKKNLLGRNVVKSMLISESTLHTCHSYPPYVADMRQLPLALLSSYSSTQFSPKLNTPVIPHNAYSSPIPNLITRYTNSVNTHNRCETSYNAFDYQGPAKNGGMPRHTRAVSMGNMSNTQVVLHPEDTLKSHLSRLGGQITASYEPLKREVMVDQWNEQRKKGENNFTQLTFQGAFPIPIEGNTDKNSTTNTGEHVACQAELPPTTGQSSAVVYPGPEMLGEDSTSAVCNENFFSISTKTPRDSCFAFNNSTTFIRDGWIERQNARFEKKVLFLYLLSMAVCNSVVVFSSRKENATEDKVYEGQSLDEVVLVQAASDNNFKLISRTPRQMELEILGTIYVYDIIAEMKFTTERKRMSIILKRNFQKEKELKMKRSESIKKKEKGSHSRTASMRSRRTQQTFSQSPGNYISVHVDPTENLGAPTQTTKSEVLARDVLMTAGDGLSTTKYQHRTLSCGKCFSDSNNSLEFMLKNIEIRAAGTTETINHREQSVYNMSNHALDSSINDPENDDDDLYPYLMLSKGADSAMLNALDYTKQYNINQLPGFQKALYDMSTSGLRTLVLAYRRLTQQDIDEFLCQYQAAHTVMGDREGALHEMYESVEKKFTLIGITALEDKLQEEVPETLQFFLQAQVVVWMLTGDKRETALTIADSTGLINLKKSIICHIDIGQLPVYEQPTECRKQLETTLQLCNNHPKKDAPVLVIDGVSLDVALAIDETKLFFEVGSKCSTGICVRMTPLQKSNVVRLFQQTTKQVCLAIGDGANDVSMIREAGIGVGIMGLESTQAELSSDFSIPKFRHLKRLMCVHGRYSLIRDNQTVLFSLYKGFLITTVQLCFNYYAGFSGTPIGSDWLLPMFNMVFLQVQTFAIGIFDRDCPPEVLETNPHLYKEMLVNPFYSSPYHQISTVVEAIIHGFVLLMIFYICDPGLQKETHELAVISGYLYENTVLYICLVFLIDCMTFLKFVNCFNVLTISLCLFPFVILFSTFALLSVIPVYVMDTELVGTFFLLFSNPYIYFMLSICISVLFCLISVVKLYYVDYALFSPPGLEAKRRILKPYQGYVDELYRCMVATDGKAEEALSKIEEEIATVNQHLRDEEQEKDANKIEGEEKEEKYTNV